MKRHLSPSARRILLRVNEVHSANVDFIVTTLGKTMFADVNNDVD